MNFTNTLAAIIQASSPKFDTAGPDVIQHGGRWFINMGRPGFNTRANNANGYASKGQATRVMMQRTRK